MIRCRACFVAFRSSAWNSAGLARTETLLDGFESGKPLTHPVAAMRSSCFRTTETAEAGGAGVVADAIETEAEPIDRCVMMRRNTSISRRRCSCSSSGSGSSGGGGDLRVATTQIRRPLPNRDVPPEKLREAAHFAEFAFTRASSVFLSISTKRASQMMLLAASNSPETSNSVRNSATMTRKKWRSLMTMWFFVGTPSRDIHIALHSMQLCAGAVLKLCSL